MPPHSTSMIESENIFLTQHPEFASTRHLDELRVTENARLDQQHHIYLDYTGGGLYADSQVRAHQALLRQNVFGNPPRPTPRRSR